MYCDASILRALSDINASTASQSIHTLDRAIIICGHAGGRLDFILSLIEIIQLEHLALTPYTGREASISLGCTSKILPLQTAHRHIPIFPDIPSISTFQSRLTTQPFILRGYARNWPAMNEHPWCSASYLRSVSGPGRVVPVEVGKDYRSETWAQKLMGWDDFLASLDFPNKLGLPPPSSVLYLAQHDLLMQFPGLRADIIIPDYVYASIASQIFPNYRPPGNDEELVINAWLGPARTISPAHTVSLSDTL